MLLSIGTNYCNSNPCQNAIATCINEQNGYRCNCPADWTGTNCETGKLCQGYILYYNVNKIYDPAVTRQLIFDSYITYNLLN